MLSNLLTSPVVVVTTRRAMVAPATATRRAMVTAVEQPIDGLHVLRGFLSPAERDAAFSATVDLSSEAQLLASSVPKHIESTGHNVNTAEVFKSLSMTLEDGRTANCEHFSDYADGHRLSYYRGVVPEPGVPALMERLAAIPAIQDELAASRKRLGKPETMPKWRLTLNHYPTAAGTAARVGFPWHRDLIANGAATMILNLGAPGSLEFGEEPDGEAPVDGLRYNADHKVADQDSVEAVESVTLTDGDLLVLTGRARWEYLHRVTPSSGGGERASLVYGVW